MKRLWDFLSDDALPLGCAGLAIIVPLWLIYKLFQGAYHLLDKLIDKL